MTRYFKTENLYPQDEILKEQTQQLRRYFEVHYANDNSIDHVNVFRNGKIYQVIYKIEKHQIQNTLSGLNKPDAASVKIITPTQITEEGTFYDAWFYDPSLHFNRVIRYWVDEIKKECYKEEYFNQSMIRTGSQRFHFSGKGELEYAFEYDELGELFNTFSFAKGETISFLEIDNLTDREKYLKP